MRATHQRLYINVDHVATLRQARRATYPDPIAAAGICERAGADGITAHLREDRRHIQDADIDGLARSVRTVLNLEMAATEEMLAIALRVHPHQVTLVPERREEVTTEGGLDVTSDPARLAAMCRALQAAAIRTSLFIDPDPESVRRAADLGAVAVELHTGAWANHPDRPGTLDALRAAATLGASRGLAVHAGHGLTTQNVGQVAAIPEIEELNIGHAIVARALFVGLDAAVREMRVAMRSGRASSSR
jgi:pyridoxine 5-phosphate synthase